MTADLVGVLAVILAMCWAAVTLWRFIREWFS